MRRHGLCAHVLGPRCALHHNRWRQHGKPAVDHFRASTGPIAERAGSEMVDAFDLSPLAYQPRLEVGYILQRRHDDRGVRVPPSTIRHLVGLLADSDTNSLLDRPLDAWLAAVRARGWKDPTRTIALLRYTYRHLCDLGGVNVEAEYASDVCYLVWLTASHLIANITSTYITCLRGFLDTSRRHHWLTRPAVHRGALQRRPAPPAPAAATLHP